MKILLAVTFISMLILPNASAYTFSVRLNINETVNTIYIPGIGEQASGSLGEETSYSNPPHYYLASYRNGFLSGLAAKNGQNLVVGSSSESNGNCGDYATQPLCLSRGCSWQNDFCFGTAASCSAHINSTYCGYDAGCTWNPATYTTKTYDFSNSGTATAYGVSQDANTITTRSTSDFATPTSPSSAETFGSITKYNLTAAGYTNIKTSNNVIAIFNSTGTNGNHEPFALFNFTIVESRSNIRWIYVLLEQRQVGSTSGSEHCYYAIMNWSSATWYHFASYMDGTADVNGTGNFTNVNDFINSAGTLSLLAWGTNMDNGEGCAIDYVEAQINYNTTANSCSGTPNPCGTYSSQSSCQNVSCTWGGANCYGNGFVNNPSHFLQIEQELNNSRIYLAATQGDWHAIDGRISLVETGNFLSQISPSFAFPLGGLYPIRLLLKHPNIDIEGNLILAKGQHRLLIENKGVSGGKPVVEIRKG